MKYTLRPYQEAAVQASVDYLQNRNSGNGIVILPTGCHAAGTKVVMRDLSTKAVENINVGDCLMGPDGKQRKVIRLISGSEQMYRVTPKRGSDPFVVNENHVLSLVSTNEGKSYPSNQNGWEVTNITVGDYLKKAKWWKHIRKLYRSGEVGHHIPDDYALPIHPWLVGVILGDGCTTHGVVSVCNPDVEVIDWIRLIAEEYHGCTIRINPKKHNNAFGINIVKASDRHDGTVENDLMASIRYLGMHDKKSEEKSVPDSYKRGSILTRYELLAGLLDTDGSHDGKGGYDFISKSKQLSDDVAFVARSLGITAHIRSAYKECQTGAGGIYYRVSLSGFTQDIPCRVARKKPAPRLQKKDPRRTGFTVQPIGIGKFYGFELTGDHLYMTDDFTVHHNSGKSLVIANTIYRLGAPALVFQPTKEILEQNVAKMESYGYRPGIYSASAGQKRIGEITFATIGSVKNIPGLFKQFPYILIDECHGVNAKGGMYKEFIEQMEHVQVLGFTASPYRLSVNSFGAELRFLTRTRPRIFKDVVFYVQNKTLFDSGFLARLEYLDIKGFNRSALRMNSTGAEFDDKSVKVHCQDSAFVSRTIDAVRQASFLRKNVLVFTRFIEESQRIVANVPNSAIVTGETPKRERERILSTFKSGQIRTICNVGVLSVGFDFPELETIILSRPTMSLGLYYQMIGRGIRPHPGKSQCQVVDLCGNYRHFGKVEDLRLVDGGNGKWFIASGEKQLTNVQNATAYSEMQKKQRFVPGRSRPAWARR